MNLLENASFKLRYRIILLLLVIGIFIFVAWLPLYLFIPDFKLRFILEFVGFLYYLLVCIFDVFIGFTVLATVLINLKKARTIGKYKKDVYKIIGSIFISLALGFLFISIAYNLLSIMRFDIVNKSSIKVTKVILLFPNKKSVEINDIKPKEKRSFKVRLKGEGYVDGIFLFESGEVLKSEINGYVSPPQFTDLQTHIVIENDRITRKEKGRLEPLMLYKCLIYSTNQECAEFTKVPFKLFSLSSIQFENKEDILCDLNDLDNCVYVAKKLIQDNRKEEARFHLVFACRDATGGNMEACGMLGRYFENEGKAEKAKEYYHYACNVGYEEFCVSGRKKQ